MYHVLYYLVFRLYISNCCPYHYFELSISPWYKDLSTRHVINFRDMNNVNYLQKSYCQCTITIYFKWRILLLQLSCMFIFLHWCNTNTTLLKSHLQNIKYNPLHFSLGALWSGSVVQLSHNIDGAILEGKGTNGWSTEQVMVFQAAYFISKVYNNFK